MKIVPIIVLLMIPYEIIFDSKIFRSFPYSQRQKYSQKQRWRIQVKKNLDLRVKKSGVPIIIKITAIKSS